MQHNNAGAEYLVTSAANQQLSDLISHSHGPFLIVSSRVGRGNYSIGLALLEQLEKGGCDVQHIVLEDYLPRRAVVEDLQHYRFISNHLRPLLHIIYRVGFFYRRKYLRELLLKRQADYQKIDQLIKAGGFRSVIAISHRPAFWISIYKTISASHFLLAGVLTEYGPSLAWRYIAWDQMNTFFSPVSRKALPDLDSRCPHFHHIQLPVRNCYCAARTLKLTRNSLLVTAGFWGQISTRSMKQLLKEIVSLTERPVIVVCGDNVKLYTEISAWANNQEQIQVLGAEENLAAHMTRACAIVTKPGMSTILEATFMDIKTFLIKGMPVAEEHNANYAIEHFGAEWYSKQRFAAWLHELSANPSALS